MSMDTMGGLLPQELVDACNKHQQALVGSEFFYSYLDVEFQLGNAFERVYEKGLLAGILTQVAR